MQITLNLTDKQFELLRCSLNAQCADFIGKSVDITKSESDQEIFHRLYDQCCEVRDMVYKQW